MGKKGKERWESLFVSVGMAKSYDNATGTVLALLLSSQSEITVLVCSLREDELKLYKRISMP